MHKSSSFVSQNLSMQEFCISYSILGHGPQDLLGQLDQQSVIFIVVDGNVAVDADFIPSI